MATRKPIKGALVGMAGAVVAGVIALQTGAAAEARLSRVPWNFGGGPLIVRLPSDPHSGLQR
jgi:hypothetical protein